MVLLFRKIHKERYLYDLWKEKSITLTDKYIIHHNIHVIRFFFFIHITIFDKCEMTHHLALLPFHLAGPIALVHLCLCSVKIKKTKVIVEYLHLLSDKDLI